MSRALQHSTGVPLPALFALLVAAACGSDPTSPDSLYPEAEPNGVNAALLSQAYARARETPGIRSLLVQRHGVLIAEEYFHDGGADSLNQVWSVTKSVTSILTGIAMEEGYISGLDQTLADFLPPIVGEIPADKGQINLGHLLTMTCGLEWHELDGGGEYSRWVRSPDMIRYVLDLDWEHAPGEAFHYHTGSTHLLAVALAQATGSSLLDFARVHLFEPLGITDVEWWQDERGFYTGGMGLYLRATDLLKIGTVFLRDGVWNGNQVVPAGWVWESTSPHVVTENAVPFGPEYGYLWWIGHGQGRDFYFANGYAGQIVLVAPDLDLVVVATSGWRSLTWDEAGAQWSGVMGTIVDGVLPAIQP